MAKPPPVVESLAFKFGKFLKNLPKNVGSSTGRVASKPARLTEDLARGLGVNNMRKKGLPVRGPKGQMMAGPELLTGKGMAVQGLGYGLGYGAVPTLGYQLYQGMSGPDSAGSAPPTRDITSPARSGGVSVEGVDPDDAKEFEAYNQGYLGGTNSFNPARYEAVQGKTPWSLEAASRMKDDDFLQMRKDLLSGKRTAQQVHTAMANMIAHDIDASKDIGKKPYILPGLERGSDGKGGKVVVIIPVAGKDGRTRYTYTAVPVAE
jgi:hypothetical protein